MLLVNLSPKFFLDHYSMNSSLRILSSQIPHGFPSSLKMSLVAKYLSSHSRQSVLIHGDLKTHRKKKCYQLPGQAYQTMCQQLTASYPLYPTFLIFLSTNSTQPTASTLHYPGSLHQTLSVQTSQSHITLLSAIISSFIFLIKF